MVYLFPELYNRRGKQAPFLGIATGVLFYVIGRIVLRRLGIAFAADKVQQPPLDSGADQGEQGDTK
jgi:hypothetical protein